MAKFIIHTQTKPQTVQNVFAIEKAEITLQSSIEDDNKTAMCICFLPESFEALAFHIGWAKETTDNQVEQGGLLAGSIYHVETEKRIYGVVKQIIPAYSADASMKHLHFSHQTWAEMMQKIDEIDHLLIGWYHTHPKHLRVYMSHTDKVTQEKFFYEDWHFSVIFNPQQQTWRAFHGKEATECLGIVAHLTI